MPLERRSARRATSATPAPGRESNRAHRLLLLKAEPPPFQAGKNMNLRHKHRLLHQCKHHRLHRCQDKPHPHAARKTAFPRWLQILRNRA